MAVAERPPVKHDPAVNPFGLDEVLTDGRLTADMGDVPVYDIRAAVLEVRRKGRQLTNEELERYIVR